MHWAEKRTSECFQDEKSDDGLEALPVPRAPNWKHSAWDWKQKGCSASSPRCSGACMGFLADQAAAEATGVLADGAGFSADFASRSIWFMPS